MALPAHLLAALDLGQATVGFRSRALVPRHVALVQAGESDVEIPHRWSSHARSLGPAGPSVAPAAHEDAAKAGIREPWS